MFSRPVGHCVVHSNVLCGPIISPITAISTQSAGVTAKWEAYVADEVP